MLAFSLPASVSSGRHHRTCCRLVGCKVLSLVLSRLHLLLLSRLFALHVLGTRTLLGAPGLTTKSKKLLGAPGIASRSKDAHCNEDVVL